MDHSAVATRTIPELENTYIELPEGFYTQIQPTPVKRPALIRLNQSLADELGLDGEALRSEAGVQLLAGNRIEEDMQPLAMAYAGHQFGHFVPSLGDGRAVLLGELIDRQGMRRDIQLKGAGRTPYSRNGDGRAVLGPVIREYVLGEAMQGLGIPTTRALAMVATGEGVFREGMEPGAVLTRVAASHVRVGTFEYFARRDDMHSVQQLADYVIKRHYPQCAQADDPYAALLEAVARRQGELIAQWLLVGFIHGVMNTDNMSIAGETIDYGPCAFMDGFSMDQVYSSIDYQGRYAYNQQPQIGHWNLTQLAGALMPLFDTDGETTQETANAALEVYATTFEQHWREGLKAKIGLPGDEQAGELAMGLLGHMQQQGADFTNSFRLLSGLDSAAGADDQAFRDQFRNPRAIDPWLRDWRSRLAETGCEDEARRLAMQKINPAFIPRNHRVQQVIDAATRQGDLTSLDKLLSVVSRPYEDHHELAEFTQPPKPGEEVKQTFCGT